MNPWRALTATALLTLSMETKASEESLYDFEWLDEDKKVFVLQNKTYIKEGKFYFDFSYLENMTSKFQDTQGLNFKGGYFFTEEWGAELFYTQYHNSDNEEYRNIKNVNGTVPFVRRLNASYGALAVYSPFYGKINTFNKIIHFDWSFGLGLAQLQAESNLKTVDDANAANTYQNETYNAGIAKTGMKFHINNNTHLGVEYWYTGYRAPGPQNPNTDKLRHNHDVMIGVGFSY